jgi:hypothetical protein
MVYQSNKDAAVYTRKIALEEGISLGIAGAAIKDYYN